MRKKIGTICVLLGVFCLLGAVGFVAYNQWEEKNASKNTQSLLEQIKNEINQDTTQNNDLLETELTEMQTMIGILSIPVLDLELPVQADWSYAKLKNAPCLYYGSCREKDFVIAAHNYEAHFGRLSELKAGDDIIFTDINGTVYSYEVVLLETLQKDATKEMIESGFDLSLYTCTPVGGSRVTVHCKST